MLNPLSGPKCDYVIGTLSKNEDVEAAVVARGHKALRSRAIGSEYARVGVGTRVVPLLGHLAACVGALFGFRCVIYCVDASSGEFTHEVALRPTYNAHKDEGVTLGQRCCGPCHLTTVDRPFRRGSRLRLLVEHTFSYRIGRSDTGGGKKWVYWDLYILNSGLKRSHLLASESSDQLSDLNSVITTSFNLRQRVTWIIWAHTL